MKKWSEAEDGTFVDINGNEVADADSLGEIVELLKVRNAELSARNRSLARTVKSIGMAVKLGLNQRVITEFVYQALMEDRAPWHTTGRQMFAKLLGHARVAGSPGYDKPIEVGELVKVDVPINCQIFDLEAGLMHHIWGIANMIAEHWADQEGVNAALIDELAKAMGYETERVPQRR